MPSRSPFALPCAILVTSVFLTGLAALSPAADRPVAAVFPPWWTSGQVFAAAARADAPVIRVGAFSSILVMPSASAELSRRLREAGALLLLDARAAGGCAVKL